MEIRKIEAQADRVETGPVQFGDDWPGLFIRGDNCLWMARSIDMAREAAEKGGNTLLVNDLNRLAELFKQVDARLQEPKKDYHPGAEGKGK